MHDPKTYHNDDLPRFEKDVQQKMEELSFTPSDGVWANVARAVNETKRRRIPVFWLFFLPAFLLMGAAGVYFFGGYSGKTGTAINGVSSTASSGPAGNGREWKGEKGSNNLNDQESNGQQSNNLQQSNKLQSDNQPARHDGQPGNPGSNAQQPNSRQTYNQQPDNHQSAPGQSTANSQSGKMAPPVIDQSAAIHPTETNLRSATNGRKKTQRPTEEGSERSSIPFADRSVAGNGKLPGNPAAGKRTADISGESAAAKTGEVTFLSKISGVDVHPVPGRIAPKITAAPLATKNLAITKTQLRSNRAWEAGFAGGIGVSSLNQALLKQSAIAAYASRNTAAITGQPQTYISKIQPDLAFWVGILMQKPILNNLSFSTGLNLRYYSARIHTGDKVELSGAASNPSGPSYNYSAALSAITYAAAPPTSYPYYNAGVKQAFINRYYFLEIPASVQWQITHNRQMPVLWEGGFSLSYLVGSNALYYNNKAGVYYKDGDVSNKIQFNLATALMIGIPVLGVNLQAGPQIQYGLTSLLNTQNSGQHLFYGGLKMVVIPGKSHKAGRRLFNEE